MSKRLSLLFAVLALSLALPALAQAQPVASERASLSQTIDGTTIVIDYARPRIRGRGEPFGDIVYIGDHRWTPGANWATMLTSNKDFTLNGQAIPEGTWSLWIDLEEDGWTLILDPQDSLFHIPPPEDSDEQIRIALEPREGPFMESLIFWIPETRLSGFDLRLGWGTTEIPFEVEVEPTFQTDVVEADALPLVGDYQWTWVPREASGDADHDEDAGHDEHGDEAEGHDEETEGDEHGGEEGPGDHDEADHDEEGEGGHDGDEDAAPSGPPPPMEFELAYVGTHLEATASFPGPDGPMTGWLLPLGGSGTDLFQLAWVQDGELWELFTFWIFEVVRDDDGQVVGLDVRNEDDTLAATVRRAGS